MIQAAKPLKVYTPRSVDFAAFRPTLVFVALATLVSFSLFRQPTLGDILVVGFGGAVFLVSAIYFDMFAGRAWIYLYDEHLAFQQPISNLVESWLGLSIWKTEIPYRHITALGRPEYERQRGAFLVIHRGRGWRSRKFFVPCNDYEQYLDFKNELLRRIPPCCKLYTWRSFGRKGPF